jgi:hypothetical protein
VNAWGEGPFDNADAADFVGDLTDAGDSAGQVLEEALRAAASDGAGVGELSRAVAAACMVAARLEPGVLSAPFGTVDGAPGEEPDEELGEWLASAPFEVTDALRRLAHFALERVIQPDGNEWYSERARAGAAERVTAALMPYRAALV